MLAMRDEIVRLGACLTASAALHYALLAHEFNGYSGSRIGPMSQRAPSILQATIAPLSAPAPVAILEPGESAEIPPFAPLSQPPLSEPATPHDDPLNRAGMRLAIIDDYLPAHLLSERPYPSDSIDPTPKGAKFEGLVGTASLLLLISSEGRIDAILVLESSLPQAIVNEAIAAFEAARFQPGKINGHAVRSRMTVQLNTAPPEPSPDAGIPHSAKILRESQLKARGEGK